MASDHITLTTNIVDGVARIALSGEFDIASARCLDEALQAANGQPVVVDLAGVVFMDSSGLRSLLRAARDRDADRLRIVGVNGRVADVIELAGLSARLPLGAETATADSA